MSDRPVYKTINKSLTCEECGNPPTIFTNDLFFCGDDCLEMYIETWTHNTWYKNIEDVEIEEDI